MKKNSLLLLSFMIASTLAAQPKTIKPIAAIIDSALTNAVVQYHHLAAQLPEGVLPKTYNPFIKKLETSGSQWWTSGFYSGSLLYLFEYSKDKYLLEESLKRQKLLEKEQFNKGTHDLGFMMFNSFGHANKLYPSKAYSTILLNSAKSLLTRFHPVVGVIKSWDHGRWQYPVIIDNMMNLELLFWATQNTGDSSFYHLAITHANTTLQNHFRADHSSWHVVDYDSITGKVIAKKTAQGYADQSAWARGQAWGLYGFTVMYRFTKNDAYLLQANQIAHFILGHPRLPSDKVPYWDYDTPDIPATYRDASAAAITASALIELSTFTNGKNARYYLQSAEKIIRSLASPTYMAAVGENGGFLLKHSVGNLPGNSEIDAALSYADYYFIEAMMRYKALGKHK